MKNAGMAGAVALVGIGLLSIGLSNFANRAEAVPSVVSGDERHQPRIVALEVLTVPTVTSQITGPLVRMWSNGVIEYASHTPPQVEAADGCSPNTCFASGFCGGGDQWNIFAPSTEGLTCTLDANGDGEINGSDLGTLIANWGPTSAALLFNPETGNGEAVALSVSSFEYGTQENNDVITIYRQWDTGVVEFCLPGASSEVGGCLFRFPWDNSCCDFSGALEPYGMFTSIPFTLPISQQLGDFDRSGAVDGGDLGRLLGAWPVCVE